MENLTKENAKGIIVSDAVSSHRFQELEKFVRYITRLSDIRFLVNHLSIEKVGMIRDRIVDHLMKIHSEKPRLIARIMTDIRCKLLDEIENENNFSILRRKAVLALAHFGDAVAAKQLRMLLSRLHSEETNLCDAIESILGILEKKIKYRLVA